MASPIDSVHGPSWAEVIIGVALSFVLGVLLAAVLLVIKPIETVTEVPKEPLPGVVYYVEGSKDPIKGRPWTRKRQQLVAGQSVSLNDDELNAVIPPPAAPPAPAKGVEPEPPPSGLIVGNPNFHLLAEELQIAVPCTLHILGMSHPVIVMATGSFRKEDDIIAFDPREYYVGSLNITRFPNVPSFITDKLLAGQLIPADLVDSWAKLADVKIESNALRLTMP